MEGTEVEIDIRRQSGNHSHTHQEKHALQQRRQGHQERHNGHKEKHQGLQVTGTSADGPKTARGQMNVTGSLTNAKIPKRVVSNNNVCLDGCNSTLKDFCSIWFVSFVFYDIIYDVS